MTFSFRENTACLDDVLAHFRACDSHFIDELAKQTDIEVYSQKILRLARCFEAWEQHQLIGLVAAYSNHEKQSAYITNVSVLPAYQSQGIGSQLFQQCLTELVMLGAKNIELDVAIDNFYATKFYSKHAFLPDGINGLRLHMTRYGDKDDQ